MASLDFIILKINNNDISQMPKNEAVQMFLYSDDPLLLEVRRKHPTLSSDFAHSQNIISSKLENLNISNNDTNNLEIENDLVVTLSSIRSNSTNENMTKASMSKTTQTDGGGYIYALDHHLTKENAERVVEQEHNLFEQCLESEIDIEEITLRKTNSNESLGLTVCYSSMYSSNNNNNNNGTLTVAALDDNELCTDVYISDIQADSVAGRDGRLRQGDQILQINGKDIKNKDETEALIAENNNAVTFLVSRYLFVDEDDFNDPCCIVELNENVCIEDDVGDDDEDVDDDDGDLDYDTQNYLSYENGFVLNNSTKPLAETINLTKSNDVTKDGSFSGDIQKQISSKPAKTISKGCTFPTKHPTTASKQHSSINENNDIKVKTLNKHTNGDNLTKPKGDAHKNTPPSPCIVSHGKLLAPAKQKIVKPGLDYDVEHIYETIPEDSESEPFYCSPYETSMYLTAMGSCSSGAPDSLQVQNQKQRVAQWLGIKSNAIGSPSQRHIQRAATGGNIRGETLRSAFTVATSGSSSSGGGAANGSTAVGTLFQEDHENSSSAYNTGGSNNSATKPGISSQQTQNCDAKRTCERFPNSRDKDSEVFENYHNDKTMLINDSSLAQNSMFQKHFSFKQNPAQHQQGIKQSDQFNAPNLSQYHFVSSQEVSAISTNAAVNIPKNNTQKTDDQMVWKVKRRPDGTRYIVRRPARKYLLKERNLHIAAAAAHITHDTTTEDDTISEVKIGRYWPKEERKKHIERAKERRLQQYQHQNEITRTLKSASFSLGGGNAEKPTQKFQTQQQLRHVRQHDVESRLLQDHHHRQQQKYFQLQFNSVHSCVESASKKPCELLSEDFDDQNKYLPTTSKAIGLDAAAVHFNSSTTLPVSATAKNEKPQTEKALNSAGFRTIAMLDHEENSKLSNEIDKTTNLFSISS